MSQPAAPATESATAAIRGMSSQHDARALDAAVRRFPVVLHLIRAHCATCSDIPPHLVGSLKMFAPQIVREYRLILAKERG